MQLNEVEIARQCMGFNKTSVFALPYIGVQKLEAACGEGCQE